ncbi:hypothetical protein P4T20_19195, partial [Aneurinibacillus thermoaerophilus]|nr:hypothetical protein [Aneurinibacillus thermoaerophilus]
QKFETVDKRLDGIDRKLEAVDERFNGIDRKLEAVDKRFDEVDGKFEAADKRFDELDRLVQQNFEEMKQLISAAQVKNLESDNLILREIGNLRAEVRYAIDTAHENREQIHRLKSRLG